ncbi:MAG TPA: hypothetical protein VLF89_00165 [Candidatus Saccharimonadales bacterium]|nr:hypothetical protein [Candidatus Saccharimonadales bacterium]
MSQQEQLHGYTGFTTSHLEEEMIIDKRLPTDISMDDLYPLVVHAIEIQPQVVTAESGIRASTMSGLYNYEFGRDSMTTAASILELKKTLPNNEWVHNVYMNTRKSIYHYWDYINEVTSKLPHEIVKYDPNNESHQERLKRGFYQLREVHGEIYCVNENSIDVDVLALSTTAQMIEFDEQLAEKGILNADEVKETKRKLLPIMEKSMNEVIKRTNETDNLLCYYQDAWDEERAKKNLHNQVFMDSEYGGDTPAGRDHIGFVAACEVQAYLWKAYGEMNRVFSGYSEISALHLGDRQQKLKEKFNKHFVIGFGENGIGIAHNIFLHDKELMTQFINNGYAAEEYQEPTAEEKFYIEQNPAVSICQAKVLNERLFGESIIEKRYEPGILQTLTRQEDPSDMLSSEYYMFSPNLGIKTFPRISASNRGDGYHNGTHITYKDNDRLVTKRIKGIYWPFTTDEASDAAAKVLQAMSEEDLEKYKFNPLLSNEVAFATLRLYRDKGTFVEQVIELEDGTVRLHNDGKSEERGSNYDQTWNWARFLERTARLGLLEELLDRYQRETIEKSLNAA